MLIGVNGGVLQSIIIGFLLKMCEKRKKIEILIEKLSLSLYLNERGRLKMLMWIRTLK